MLAQAGNLLGFIWVLPVSILFWILAIPLGLTGQIQSFDIWPEDFKFLWDLTNDGWFCKTFFKKRGWGGFSFGNNIIVVDSDTARWSRIVDHEARHCFQQYICGVLFFPIYMLVYIWIFLFCSEKHPYYSHPFERDARKHAGQRVDIPKKDWKKGRWAWW